MVLLLLISFGVGPIRGNIFYRDFTLTLNIDCFRFGLQVFRRSLDVLVVTCFDTGFVFNKKVIKYNSYQMIKSTNLKVF